MINLNLFLNKQLIFNLIKSMIIKILICLIAIVVSKSALANPDTTTDNLQNYEDEKEDKLLSPSIDQKRYISIISHFFSGKPNNRTNYDFQNFNSWKSYCLSFDNKWESITKKRIANMVKWRNKELQDINIPLFYPMGGPDVLSLLTFFPNSNKYIMVGLEPIVDIVSLQELQNEDIVNELLDNLEKSMSSLFIRSFFISKDMADDLKKIGVIPLLMALITRLDYEIINFRTVTLKSEEDKVKVIDYTIIDSENNEPKKTIGVEIIFKSNNSDTYKTLYYFKKNLHNSASPKQFLKFVEQNAPFAVMLKSTSYAFHCFEFSEIGDFIYDNGTYLLQDDTGIPYKKLKQNWDIKLYGQYTKPYGEVFKDFIQLDLADEYIQNNDIPKLNFAIGYGYGRAPSCLMIGKRKN